MEQFIMDLAQEKEYVPELLDRIAEYTTSCGLRLMDIGADMLWTGDDFGMQNGMMISPALWRRMFKPRMKAMFEAFRRHNPVVKIAYHSCGSIVPIIGDLVEIGLDALNPVQPAAKGMDLALFKLRYGKKLAFFGGVDVQAVLPRGTIDDVRDEVKGRICAAAKGGGYIVAPAHNIQPDTSIGNILAFYEAVREFGRYPTA